MVYTYTPTYYSSFQDTVASLCKSILLPFSLNKNRRLPAEQKLAKHHADNLKWQQESFHRILNLIGLQKEGIVPESEVSAFRSHLLDTLIASPSEQEQAGVVRDKLLFLQELFYAKCISADEYHSSKRPLLQRLAVQGAEIDCRDVIVGNPTPNLEEEWSVIELRDKESPSPAEKTKRRTPIKSLINWKGKQKKDQSTNSNNEKFSRSETNSILMPESATLMTPKSHEKTKRKPFRALFQKEQSEEEEDSNRSSASGLKESALKSEKKQGVFDKLRSWRKNGISEEDESTTPYLLSEERSDNASQFSCTLVASPIGEGPDTKRIKKKIHSDGSSSDFFIDKVLGENIKKELSRIQSELSATNPNINLSDEQMETISTRLPVDKADLKNFFPKSWCDRYGDIVLDVVRKEFKDHVGEMESLRSEAKENRSSGRWVAFEENDENFHPNLFGQNHPQVNQGANAAKSKLKDDDKNCFVNNPFVEGQNPFWTPRS